jgi:phosphoribosylglycinamide formyltransferase-1
MSNTHPGILPETTDTYGTNTQAKVLELGLTETAHTVHVVAAGVDEGPIIAEHRVRVFAPSKFPAEMADTPESLFARVRRIEKAHLALDLDAFLKNQAQFYRYQEA